MFKLHTPFSIAGDQKRAIDSLTKSRPGISTLMGITGSGKTYTIAQVIAQQNKSVLIISPNKTLAAQLYEEFSTFFPDNKVCYFVSYYDYYRPESFLPAQNVYIPKETRINAEVERLRIEATASVINRKDTIIITSVSCIYGLGNPIDYKNLALPLVKGDNKTIDQIITKLQSIQYVKNNREQKSGTFQVHDDTIEITLPYQKEILRVIIQNGIITALQWTTKNTGEILRTLDDALIFPAKHFVIDDTKKQTAINSIQQELEAWIPHLSQLSYQERIKQRVHADIELLKTQGYCNGIENYSRHFDQRLSGSAPFCLLDFFDDMLIIIDESHITVPQLRGMYAGDQNRKNTLIQFGFRLPSARDNRPLSFTEIEAYFKDVIFVSATPSDYELRQSKNIVEQVIRPTGLVDPEIVIHPRENQLIHLKEEIDRTTKLGFRSIITVMTKKMAEDLAQYLEELQIKTCYLHSNLKTPERTSILHKLRAGIFDCVVGVNLLREGIDIPEVALVAIMDADIESFLRDKRSLIQIIGRAARNVHGKVILYADKITKSMQSAMEETYRRRSIQLQHNSTWNITPTTVQREIKRSISPLIPEKNKKDSSQKNKIDKKIKGNKKELEKLQKSMAKAAQMSDFDRAIQLRTQIEELTRQISTDQK